jgi:adenosylmethionine-8-amino-7-oxononanoate aminotransferase
MGMYHPTYLKRAREICDRYEVHLIADEIAVGFGRTGTLFACEQAGIAPDFLCLSKGITGGYLPLSVVMTTDKVYGAFYDEDVRRGFLHSHSYTGNALACRAALTTLDIFEQDKMLKKNRATANRIAQAAEALRAHPRVRQFRQTGMILAFEVADAPADFAQRFYRQALENELLLRPIGNTIYFMTPYAIDEEEIALLVERTLRVLNSF